MGKARVVMLDRIDYTIKSTLSDVPPRDKLFCLLANRWQFE